MIHFQTRPRTRHWSPSDVCNFVKKKRKLFMGLLYQSCCPVMSPSSTHCIVAEYKLHSLLQNGVSIAENPLIVSKLIFCLGSTHSKLNTIVSITFPTLVMMSFTSLLATNTKICTRGRSISAHAGTLSQPPRSPTLWNFFYLLHSTSIGSRL